MAFPATAVLVLIASPGDTSEERAAVQEILGQWNVGRGEQAGVVVVPWLYEQHAVPVLGDHPQSVINKQAVERADIVVAFFDARLGTETPRAVSGTAEEILEAHNAGKPVHVYFSNEPVGRENIDPEQLAALQEFKDQLHGLLGVYTSPIDLANRVSQAIDFDITAHPEWADAQSAASVRAGDVRWELSSNGGDTYLATNVGDAIAYEAKVQPHVDLHMPRSDPSEDLAPGESLQFMAVRFAGGIDDPRVRVTWFDDPDHSTDQRSWKNHLPQRPPRPTRKR